MAFFISFEMKDNIKKASFLDFYFAPGMIYVVKIGMYIPE